MARRGSPGARDWTRNADIDRFALDRAVDQAERAQGAPEARLQREHPLALSLRACARGTLT
jgi:hypothetical protein